MAIAVLTQVQGAGLDTFEAVHAKVGVAEDPAEGLLVFTAAATEDGGYFVFNVWESKSAWEKFRDERLSAARQQVWPEGIAPPKVSVWELHTFQTF